MIWFGLYLCIPTIVSYLMPNPFYTYISNIYELVFSFVGFYSISTIEGYLITNPLYIYIYIYIYRLTCLNTNFQKREGKLWTHTYTNKSKAQIDYLFINRKWKNSAMNCEAYSTFEGVSSDHRIVTAKIRLSLRKSATRTATTRHYDWTLLNNRDIRDKYALELRNRFETLQEKTEKVTPNDEYENFV